jgi:hypothetical protein
LSLKSSKLTHVLPTPLIPLLFLKRNKKKGHIRLDWLWINPEIDPLSGAFWHMSGTHTSFILRALFNQFSPLNRMQSGNPKANWKELLQAFCHCRKQKAWLFGKQRRDGKEIAVTKLFFCKIGSMAGYKASFLCYPKLTSFPGTSN